MNSGRVPNVLGPGAGEALWSFGTLTAVKATASDTGGRFAIIEDLAPRGAGTPLHLHREDDESFYVLEGEVAFALGADPLIRATAGSFIHIPGGVVHAFRVESATARYLIITTPWHERFYRAISEPALHPGPPPESPLDMEKVEAACQEYGVELIGPWPEDCG